MKRASQVTHTECLTGSSGAQRAKITEKVHKPPRNHYIEWPVFSDIGLNCESQGEKGRTCKKYKILIGSPVFFFSLYTGSPFFTQASARVRGEVGEPFL